MQTYLPIVTVFVSGLFGLLAAVVAFRLGAAKDVRAAQREAIQKRVANLECLYVDCLANLERVIRATKRMSDYETLFEQMAHMNARMALLAAPEVFAQDEAVSVLLYEWSSHYRRGAPKPMGVAGMAVISSNDQPHIEAAAAVYPKLSAEMLTLIKLMKEHLKMESSLQVQKVRGAAHS